MPERDTEPVHYTASTLITAFGETRSVYGWSELLGQCVKSLLRKLNALPDLPVELVLEMPRCVRIKPGAPPGGPRSWTWDALPWEADQWAQTFVAEHPGGGSLQEVGDALGMTREAVRQIEERSMRKIERAACREGLIVQDLLEVLLEVRDKRAQVML